MDLDSGSHQHQAVRKHKFEPELPMVPQLASSAQRGHATLPHEDTDADPDERRRIRVPLHPNGHQLVGQIELRTAVSAPSHLLVHIPERHRDRPYEVAIRQLYAGREVGRITWRLVPKL